MKLYEINSELEKLIDQETGEVFDFEAFTALAIERGEKLENIALWIKNLRSDAAALKAEEKSLADRRRIAENKEEQLERFLESMLTVNEKFETPRVKLSWRKSESVKILVPDEKFVEWAKDVAPQFLNFSEPTISKTAIKEAIKAGNSMGYADILISNNLQIK